jgi:multiple sugar transport system permease protein
MRRKGVNYAKYGYIFCIPFVLIFLLFSLYPIFYTAVIGFTDMKGIGKTTFNFLDNPFKNYETILTAPTFQTSLFNTALLWLVNFLPQILLALILAAWFTNQRRKIKGQGFFKVLFYMPNIITAATIAILFSSLFGYPTGPMNSLFQSWGLIDGPYGFLNQKWIARLIVSFIQFWMWYGNTMIVLIAGILGINPEIYQAAEIDGANGMQTFFDITLPNLRTILVYTLVTSLIGGLQMFDIPKLFLNGGPDNGTITASVFIYNQAFSGSYMFARASAASMIMFVIIVALACVLFYVMRDKYEVKQRKIERAVARAERKARKTERRA